MYNQKILVRMVIAGAFWIMALFQMVVDQTAADSLIVTAFASMDTQMAESKMEITAVWSAGELNTSGDRRLVLKKQMDKLDFHGSYQVSERVRDGQLIEYIELEQDAFTAIVEIISGDDTGNVYGYTELIIPEHQMKDIFSYKSELESLYKRLGAENTQTILKFEGEYPGQLSGERRSREAQRLFHSLRAEKISEMEEGGLYTVYGYTKLVKEYMQVFRNRINLTIAFSYDEEKDVTRMYLATPILNDDY